MPQSIQNHKEWTLDEETAILGYLRERRGERILMHKAINDVVTMTRRSHDLPDRQHIFDLFWKLKKEGKIVRKRVRVEGVKTLKGRQKYLSTIRINEIYA